MDSNSSIILRRVVYGVVIGVIVYGAFAFLGDAEVLADNFQQVPFFVIAAACGLSALNYLLRFFKWHLYLRFLDIDINPGHSLIVFLAGLVMSISPGKIGEVIKSVLLKRSHDLSMARTAPVVFAERLTDVLGLLILASVGIFVFQYGVVGFVSVLTAVVALVIVVQSPNVVSRILDFVEALPWVGKYRNEFEEAYQSTRTLLKWRPLAATTLLSALGWSMEVLAFVWLLHHLGAAAPLLLESFFVYSTATLVGAISFLPGGLGITEASLTGLLVWIELFDELTPALAATYLIRFTTLWFGVIVGFLSFLLYEWRQRKTDNSRRGDYDSPDVDQ